tara:strand:- start:34 stop:192 length:159 start_codon:yes stop_codon:yes gene_type:complete
MTGWQTAWTWIFSIAVFLFFLVEVVVVVGGARDIGDMMRSLMGQADENREES